MYAGPKQQQEKREATTESSTSASSPPLSSSPKRARNAGQPQHMNEREQMEQMKQNETGAECVSLSPAPSCYCRFGLVSVRFLVVNMSNRYAL